jgi:hypothetical protein
MVHEKSRPCSRSFWRRQWLVWLCLWLSCSPSGPQDSESEPLHGAAIVVGRRADSRVNALREPYTAAERPLAEGRMQAVTAWRHAPGEDSALGLARAYFPEFASSTDEQARKAPVNPAAALRVKLPATEGGELEIVTRGSVFTVRQEGGTKWVATITRTTSCGARIPERGRRPCVRSRRVRDGAPS